MAGTKEATKGASKGRSKGASKPNPSRKDTLNPRQEQFAENYATNGGNTRKAAIDAGYAESTANVDAYRLLDNPRVQERIEQRRLEARQRANVHTDEITGTLVQIASVSMADLLDERGDFSWATAKAQGVDHLVKKFKKTTRYIPRKDADPEKVETVEFELYDKLGALNQLRDNFGMKQEPRRNTFAEFEEAVSRLKAEAKGNGIELSDEQARALMRDRLGDVPLVG